MVLVVGDLAAVDAAVEDVTATRQREEARLREGWEKCDATQ